MNAVAPGWIRSKFLEKHEERVRGELELTPLRRWGTPEDVGAHFSPGVSHPGIPAGGRHLRRRAVGARIGVDRRGIRCQGHFLFHKSLPALLEPVAEIDRNPVHQQHEDQ